MAAPLARPDIQESPEPFLPPVPSTMKDLGVSPDFITDLILKMLYVQGARAGHELTEALKIPFSFVDDLLMELQHRYIVQVRGTTSPSRPGYLFDLVNAGRERAREALSSSQYVGPMPVPLAQYQQAALAQSSRLAKVTHQMVRDGFRALVVGDEVLEMLGPAINAGRSLFLYGAPGNGKTVISEAVAGMLGGAIYIPHAIEVEGQILNFFDPVHHRPDPIQPEVQEDAAFSVLRPRDVHDRRFVRIHRPIVLTGGELTIDQLDLRYDPVAKMYQAPFQTKANGGVLILDDFGRQRAATKDLLNRWIVPLEKRVDYLTLHTGGKFPVPFDVLVVFATNLSPADLVDEAFLRRLQYKIRVPGPTRAQYAEIFARCCAERQVQYHERAVGHVYTAYYERLGIPVRACHPRDLLDHFVALAEFLSVPRQLTLDLLDRACQSYFVDGTEAVS